MPYDAHSAHLDVARVSAVLTWYGAHARDLPWRRPGCSAWGVLVSEVMLQQTPVVRVLPAWERWMERWPTPSDLATDSQADAVRAWERLGYPRRAKRLWECARVLVDEHGGEVPADADALLALPGVGEYTAAAVESFAFGRRAVVLDTNVRRVIGRAWSGEPLPRPGVTRAERDLAGRIVPAEASDAARWAVASMELGALVCTARAPRCDGCPLAATCVWFAEGLPGLAEAPRRTQPWHGTDRQVRGRVMALLREAHAPLNVVGRAVLEDVDPGQLDRCLDGLSSDGLIALVDAERGLYALA
ncbi:MAG: adenine glycosylase [Actinobacteria bacterium HGW-Actinobacteria-8]|nr:MAG: adenine glycosylase [Actinobacteria bacterium HGW-Actinobacteria-8]